jgi:GTPase
MSVHYVHCGQTATLALDGLNDPNWKIHKGMVLLGSETPACCTEFEADLMVLYHATGVSTGMCGMVNSGSIRQHARVISVTVSPENELSDNFDNLSVDKETLVKLNVSKGSDTAATDSSESILTSGTQGKVTFRFMYEPCYLRLGAQILFMEGRSKCLGRITRLIPHIQSS